MKQKLYDYFIGGRNFKKELKKQVRLLIIITLGFTIAFSWRQTIFDLTQIFVDKIIKVHTTISSPILTSIFITIFSLIFIYFTSQILKDKPEQY